MAKISDLDMGESIPVITKTAGKYPQESYVAIGSCDPIGMDLFVMCDKRHGIHMEKRLQEIFLPRLFCLFGK